MRTPQVTLKEWKDSMFLPVLKGWYHAFFTFSFALFIWRMHKCYTINEKNLRPGQGGFSGHRERPSISECNSLFALKLYFHNSVTSDCAVGDAEVKKSRLSVTAMVTFPLSLFIKPSINGFNILSFFLHSLRLTDFHQLPTTCSQLQCIFHLPFICPVSGPLQ